MEPSVSLKVPSKMPKMNCAFSNFIVTDVWFWAMSCHKVSSENERAVFRSVRPNNIQINVVSWC